MPSPQQSDPSAQPHPRSPTCPKCGTLMRLVVVEPNPNYVNLDMWSYTCDCGETANNLVAHIFAPAA